MGYDVLQCIVVGECVTACSASGEQPFEQGKFWWNCRSFPFLHLQTGWWSWWRLVSHRFPFLRRKPSTVAKASQDLLHTPPCLLIVGHFIWSLFMAALTLDSVRPGIFTLLGYFSSLLRLDLTGLIPYSQCYVSSFCNQTWFKKALFYKNL